MVKYIYKIGLNGSMLDDHPTGVGIYSVNVINHLSALWSREAGKTITVFTPTNKFLNSNIRTIRLSRFLKSSQYGKFAAFTRFVWNAFIYPLQVREFDLLLSTTTHGSFLLKNQIITIHDLLSLRYNNISRHQRFYFTYILPAIISRAKLVIAISETTKNDIVHFLKCPEEKVKVVYNGYDESIYNTNSKAGKLILEEYGIKNYFLAVGPTYPHKNFNLLIDAYSELDNSVKMQYPLVIAGGKKDYLNNIKEYVIKLKLDEFVTFLGYVPLSLMPALYKEAFALVFPSLYEGFGFPLVEAMACGCPVIASNASSIPEVCDDAALYFHPNKKSELVMQMNNLIADKVLRELIRDKGLNRVKKFSWHKTASQLNEIIENSL